MARNDEPRELTATAATAVQKKALHTMTIDDLKAIAHEVVDHFTPGGEGVRLSLEEHERLEGYLNPSNPHFIANFCNLLMGEVDDRLWFQRGVSQFLYHALHDRSTAANEFPGSLTVVEYVRLIGQQTEEQKFRGLGPESLDKEMLTLIIQSAAQQCKLDYEQEVAGYGKLKQTFLSGISARQHASQMKLLGELETQVRGSESSAAAAQLVTNFLSKHYDDFPESAARNALVKALQSCLHPIYAHEGIIGVYKALRAAEHQEASQPTSAAAASSAP